MVVLFTHLGLFTLPQTIHSFSACCSFPKGQGGGQSGDQTLNTAALTARRELFLFFFLFLDKLTLISQVIVS